MTWRGTVTKHMGKKLEKKADELEVKLAGADRLTLALTGDCWTAPTCQAALPCCARPH